MSVKSKSWDWDIVKPEDGWKIPARETYWLIDRWRSQGKKTFLDLGVGLGRHAIQFAKAGFLTTGFDLSETAVHKTQTWADEEGLKIDLRVGDMLNLPFEDGSFDAILAYHVISHTDTEGMRKIAAEMHRVLSDGGEFFVSLGSKRTWGWQQDWPKVDENTKRRMEEGPEYGVPHFYADVELVHDIFKDFEVILIEEMQDYTQDGDYGAANDHGLKQSGWHFYVLGRKN